MFEAVLFLLFAATMLAAWRRDRRQALGLFSIAAALSIALYLHHATDTLPLSF